MRWARLGGREARGEVCSRRDLVFLMKDSGRGPAASGPWERVVALAGELMGPADHYPARSRVRAFPDDAQLAEIGVAELA